MRGSGPRGTGKWILACVILCFPHSTAPADTSQILQIPLLRAEMDRSKDLPTHVVEKWTKIPPASDNACGQKQECCHKLPLRVFVRIRPLVSEEAGHTQADIQEGVSKMSGKRTLQMSFEANGRAQDRYFSGFTGVIQPHMDNRAAYAQSIRPLVDHIFLGRTSCGFAYGHTGIY
jgi:hypothetical protein